MSVLGAAAAGRFRTIGYQDQGKAADEVIDEDRAVQVYFDRGTFPKSGGSINGPMRHDLTLRVELTAGKAAAGDLSVLESAGSTPAQIAAALAAFGNASSAADDSFDELADIVYQILMAADNQDLGLAVGEVSSRWITEITKNPPNARGQYVVITGNMDLTCTVSEAVTGDDGKAASPTAVDLDLETYQPDSESTADPAKAGYQGGN